MHVYMQHVQHYCFSPHNRPTILHPAIDLPAPEQHTAHDRRFNASVPLLTPSLRCARRNLLQASPVIVALSRLSRRAVNETAQSGIESDRHWAALPCRLRLASSPPNVVLSFFPCIPKISSGIFFARSLSPSDSLAVTLGPQWAHPRPPTATPRTRGPPRPTTVLRSTLSSPTRTLTLPPNPHPRVCSKKEAQMSTPRCWRARGRQQP